MFEKIGDIKTWLSLIAFIGALIVTYFLRKNLSDKKQIEVVPENQRARLVEATAEKLKLDLNLIPKNERSKIIQQTLRNRIYQQIILAVSLLLAGCIIAYITITSNQSEKVDNPENNKSRTDSQEVTKKTDTGRKDIIPARDSVRPLAPVIPSVEKIYLNETLVYQFDNLNYDKPGFDFFPMAGEEAKFVICDKTYDMGTVQLHPSDRIAHVTFKVPDGMKSFSAIAGLVKYVAHPEQVGDVSFKITGKTKNERVVDIYGGSVNTLCGQIQIPPQAVDDLAFLKIEINPKRDKYADHFALVNAYFSSNEIKK